MLLQACGSIGAFIRDRCFSAGLFRPGGLMRRYYKSMPVSRILTSFILMAILSSPAISQYIDIKTIPVATGNQFQIFPSTMSSYGGISVAVNDDYNDPFINPAKGFRVSGLRLHSSPAYYSIMNNSGSAFTLPMGMVYGSQDWYGGITAAFQNMKPANMGTNWVTGDQLLSDRSLNNNYFYGMIGSDRLIDGFSVGISTLYADLDGVGGVDLLYGNASKIEQYGYVADFRLGLVSTYTPQRTFEVLLLHSRTNMTHNVTFSSWGWWEIEPMPQTVVEENLDRTRTWGMHLGFVEHLEYGNWNIGAILTFNYKTHPKIPNYRLMNIPRDPGNTLAYNLGIGIAKVSDRTTFAMEMIYEPIRSNTWADTEDPVETRSGNIIPAGGKTVENDFAFSNFRFRFGIGQESEKVGLSMGISTRSIKYILDQMNFVEERERKQRESWTEVTLSYGIIIKYPEVEFRYAGGIVLGTGQPGILRTSASGADYSFGGDFIAAPSAPLTLWETLVFTHQFTVSIPLTL
jgi:hypothetical protein